LFVYCETLSGKGQGQVVFNDVVRPLIAKYLSDFTVKVAPTTKPGGAKDCTMALMSEGCDLIVACGGDGTIHEVTNALVSITNSNSCSAGAALAVIPMGTGNDFAKAMKLLEFKDKAWTQSYEHIVQTIAKGFTIKADVGLLESTYKTASGSTEMRKKIFLNEASFGIRYVVCDSNMNKTVCVTMKKHEKKIFFFTFFLRC